jgi:PAS domain S-box-containing protein
MSSKIPQHSIPCGDFNSFLEQTGLYNLLPSAIAIYDTDAQLRYSNQAFMDLDDQYSLNQYDNSQSSSISADAELLSHIRQAAKTGQAQTVSLECYLLPSIHTELTLIANPLFFQQSDKADGVLLSMAEEQLAHDNYAVVRLKSQVNDLIARIRDLSRDQINKDGLIRNFLKSSPFAIVMFDQNRQVVQVNKAGETLFGMNMRDAMGQQCENLFDCYANNGECPVLENNKVIDRLESDMLCRAEGVVPVLRSAVLLDNAGQQVVMEAFVDISERKQAENILKDSNAELEKRVQERTLELRYAKDLADKANMAKTEFLSRMSHELRTPMNAILGFAQILEMDEALNELQLEQIQEILTAGNHLLGLIGEILDLSRIELGKMEVECKPVNLGVVFNEAVSMVSPLANQYDIDLQGCCECSVKGIVMADPLKIRAVFVNLLSNAIKYNKKDGAVAASCKVNQDVIELSITDTGIGIAEDNLDKLFEPFERFASELAEVDGTGIGLTISRSLIELMGGTITAQSELEKGSCFSICLPVHKGT